VSSGEACAFVRKRSKVLYAQAEIVRLGRENASLRRENAALREEIDAPGARMAGATADMIAVAVEKALKKLRAEHAKEIAALKKAHDEQIWEERRRARADYLSGFARGEEHAKQEAAKEIGRLKSALHEKAVDKLTEKLIERGQTKPTEKEVADAALGRGPKIERTKLPAFTEKEIAQLRKALHPDGKPEKLHKMFNEASALFNDRADLLIRAAKRAR
jgi:hypothetical protein